MNKSELETLYDKLQHINYNADNDSKKWAKLDDTDVTDYDNLIPKEDRAIEYDFTLDTFQKRAFLKIYQGHHVFVSAHTSAGKTITAEWAIALSMAKGRKAIYTSPIKALSNQKFRDFRVKFNHIELDEVANDMEQYYDDYDNYDDYDDNGGYNSYNNNIYDFDAYTSHKASEEEERVGIITGDVQLNKTAPCLILTTEILRTMIYDNDPILQELEWVIFDEIHYMNDPERGRVWEEVITLLPEHVNMLFLSATTPNAMEFSEWVGRERKQEVYVISTSKRPIPLEHYLHVGTHDKDLVKYYKTQDMLRSDAMDRLDPSDPDIMEKLQKLEKTKFTTTKLKDEVDTQLTTNDGTYLVVDRDGNYQELIEKEVKTLIKEKQKTNMKNALSFRQSKHHWLSLFKLLEIKKKFPVVVFVFSKKQCATLSEHLSNSDYSNKKEKSRIKVFIDKCLKKLKPEDRVLPQIIKTVDLLIRGIAIHHGGLLPILKEMTEILFSRGFIRILFATETFAMGINMPTRSVIFSSVQKHDGQEFRDLLPGEYTQMSGRSGRRGLDDTGTVIICHWKPSRTVYKTLISGKPLRLTSQFRLTYQTILTMIAKHSIEGGVTGLLRSSFSEFGNNKDGQQIAKITRLIKQSKKQLKIFETDVLKDGVVVWDLVNKISSLMYESLNDLYAPKIFNNLFSVGRYILVYQEASIYPNAMQITKVTDDYILANMVIDDNNANNTKEKKSELPIKIKYSWVIALCENVTVNNDKNSNQITHLKYLNVKRYKLPFITSNNLLIINDLLEKLYKLEPVDYTSDGLKLIKDYTWLRDKIVSLETSVCDSALSLYPDYHKKTKLLENLGFINTTGVLTLKGNIATRINTCHELVLTEFILEAGLNEMTTPQIAGLLSCLVASEVKMGPIDYRDIGDFDMDLYKRLKQLDEIVDNILNQQLRLEIDIDPDKFKRECFNPLLVKLIYYWANGESFAEIMKYTEVMEGTIVRSIMRLDELCQEIIRSVDVIGDPSIIEMMERVSTALRRDIVFCGSLYI